MLSVAPNKPVDPALPPSLSGAGGNMYLSVNFRWPLGQPLAGSSGSSQSNSQSPGTSITSHSAFKTVLSSSSAVHNNSNLPSSSSCSKEAAGLSGHSLQHSNMNLGMQQALPPPPPHPASQMGPASHSQGMQSMGLCPPYHGTHHTGHAGSLPSMSAIDDRGSLSSMSMAGLGGLTTPCKDVLCPPLPPPPPPPPPPSTHPAFPVPMWLQQSQAAATAYNLSHLQQVFGHDKAFAASQYLAAADPFAKAANPFLDLARMGHYPLGKKLFGCPQCRYITDRKNNLKRHIATMHQECDKTLECCGVLFKNKASLRDHVLIFHSNGYMCRFCGRNFCRKALLKRHLTVHSGQKDYICSLCDYATSHKSNLERHKKVHDRQSQDGSEEGGCSEVSSHRLPDSSSSTGVSSTSDQHHLQRHRDDAGIPAATSSPRAVGGGAGGGGSRGLGPEHHLPLENPSFSPSMADTSFTSDSLTENDDDLALSPINVDDDPNALIDVVELAN